MTLEREHEIAEVVRMAKQILAGGGRLDPLRSLLVDQTIELVRCQSRIALARRMVDMLAAQDGPHRTTLGQIALILAGEEELKDDTDVTP